MRPKNTTITPQELEIMKVVWELGSATVRDVYEALLARRRVAYTTVLTMMGILERKGYLTRRSEGRTFLYRPKRSKQTVLGSMVSDLVRRVFDGSAEPLLQHLVSDKHLSEEELERIARRIREQWGNPFGVSPGPFRKA